MRLIGFIALAVFIIWVWPFIFQKPATDTPQSSPSGFTNVERQYYRQVFDYAMETVKPGASYGWETSGGRGSISVGKQFESKSGYICRNYNEIYTISGAGSGSNEGTACKRQGRSGWCRLKSSDALTCALEPPGSVIEKTVRGTEDAIEAGKDVLGKMKDMIR